MAPNHVVVVDEAAGGQDEPVSSTDAPCSLDRARDRPDDPTVARLDQRLDARPERRPNARSFRGRDQLVHQQRALVPDRLRRVASRRGFRDLVEGPRCLAPREHEPVVGMKGLVRAGEEALLVGHALIQDPVEVRDTAFAVGLDQASVGLRTTRGHHVLVHVLRRVLVAERLLERGPAAAVEEATGVDGGPAGAPAPLDHDHVAPRCARLEGSAGPCAAVAHDHHVGLLVPRRDVSFIYAQTCALAHLSRPSRGRDAPRTNTVTARPA